MSDGADIFRLDGRAALVTGAARGIGAEIARVLAALGARVAMADVMSKDKWEPAALKLSEAPSNMRLTLDVASTARCVAVMKDVVENFGGLDILVNNAAINARQPAEDTDDETWARLMDVNLHGAFRMARAAFPHLKQSKHAAIVNMASTGSYITIPNNVPYCVSKAGIAHMTEVLAHDWGPLGIRVNAVAPTVIATDMTADLRADDAFMKNRLGTIPMGRLPSTTDVANAVAFLASSAAGMITGQVLAVDGGAMTK